MFFDQSGKPLPGGTALRVPALDYHEGIVAYDSATGAQVMLHNSKKRGCVALTTPDEFCEGHPVMIVRGPRNSEQATLVVQQAWQDVQSGRRWTAFDNCQDFVSRAYDGRNGSVIRTFIIGTLLFAGLAFSLAKQS